MQRAHPPIVYGVLVTLAAACLIWVNQPGYLDYDSVVQWYQGRFNVFLSADPLRAHPPLMSFLWRGLDRLYPGPLPMLALQTILLALAMWCLLLRFRPIPAAAAGIVVLLALNPFVFVNEAKIVKDVLGGHVLLLAFALLLVPGPDRRNTGWLLLAGAMVAVATLIRYQFVLGLPCICLAAMAVSAGRGWRAACPLAGFAAALIGLSVAMQLCLNLGPSDIGASLRKVALYDIAGVVVRVPSADLAPLAQAGVDPAEFRRRVSEEYTPNLVDPLWTAEQGSTFDLIGDVATPVLFRQWLDLVRDHPLALARHHFATYARVLGLGDVWQCDVFYKNHFVLPEGIEGVLTAGPDGFVDAASLAQPRSLSILTARYFPTGSIILKSYAYVLAGLALLALLGMVRLPQPHRPERAVLMLLVTAGVLYHLSFLLTPQACEIRYSYFTVLASLYGWCGAVLLIVASRGGSCQPA